MAKCEALLGDLNSDNSISENTSQEQVRGPSSTSTISLTTTQRLIQNVQELINREPNFDKRRTYKERISNIKTKYSETQKALQMRQREQRKRMENGTVQAQSSSNQSIHDTYSKNAENLSRDELFSYPSGFSKDKASNEGASDRISRSLQQSLNYVDQYLDMGQSSLNKLREQGIDLKVFFLLNFLLIGEDLYFRLLKSVF